MPTEDEKPVWVGMIQVVPAPGNLQLRDGMAGAFVWVAAPAGSCEEFAELARVSLEVQGFDAVEAHDMRESWTGDLGEETTPIVNEAERFRRAVVSHTFHCYPPDGSESESD